LHNNRMYYLSYFHSFNIIIKERRAELKSLLQFGYYKKQNDHSILFSVFLFACGEHQESERKHKVAICDPAGLAEACIHIVLYQNTKQTMLQIQIQQYPPQSSGSRFFCSGPYCDLT
ncbi:MAG: hypothetical protein K5908_03530, partial [Erysipelotrichaceae bacterium]|nr:hypothetical protein [Erysipelotrichaceae bacterium]